MNGKEIKFSVITGCYNQLPLLKKALPYWNSQNHQEFEWIIADDGSDNADEIGKWCEENDIKFVTHEKDGFRLAKILNDATKESEGEYLVYVFADSYPEANFIEQMGRTLKDDRIVCGLRVQVDEEGLIVGNDWRLDRVMFPVEGQDEIKIYHQRPWELMTSNGMGIPKKAQENLGGWFEEYKGYGREDWDLIMRGYYSGMDLYWAPNAKIYHLQHDEKNDTPDNVELFDERLKHYATQ